MDNELDLRRLVVDGLVSIATSAVSAEPKPADVVRALQLLGGYAGDTRMWQIDEPLTITLAVVGEDDTRPLGGVRLATPPGGDGEGMNYR